MKPTANSFFKIILAAVILSFYSSCKETNSNAEPINEAAMDSPVDKVYPQLDSENSRWFFFSSASRPFGMVNLSPDTEVDGAWGSGYRYKVDTIQGFSHIHAWQLSGLSVLPVTTSEENKAEIFKDYKSKFSHETEKVSPGYHYVELDRYGITAELTSTKRVGLHKYNFPKDKNAAVLFNLNGMLGPNANLEGQLNKTSDNSLTGELVIAPTHRRPKSIKLFFSIDLNTEITAVEKDSETGNYLVSLANKNESVLMKVSISYTSIENATNNKQTELPDWDFNQIVSDSKKEWNAMLGRITIEGGDEKAQRRFYTDLWHALQGRRVISDVNGAYPDNTGDSFRIGQLPLDAAGKPKFNHYNSDSFWGAQWTINTLWGLVYPEIMDEFVHSLMQYYKDGGLIPRGPSGGNYTYVMTGSSSTPFIVSAIQKGIIKDNLEEIYQALKKNHMPGGIMEKAGYEHNTALGGGLKYYIKDGYVPHPIPEGKFGGHQDGASLTMEYAYQDWTLAQLAKKLGHSEDYDYFTNRSNNYKNVFDTKIGWMHPKDVNGNWSDNYSPYEHEHGFIESNGAQSTWFVPHNIEGLANLMGGKEKAVEKLNTQFEKAEKLGFTAGSSHSQELHPEYREIPINYGNQPSMQTAYVFNKLDRPDLTQYWSRKVVDKAFSGLGTATGYNGDEDQGLMGSLAVLLKIGLFQMNGGTEENTKYELGSPIFDRATIQLNKDYYTGDSIQINTINNSSKNVFLSKMKWDNKPLEEFYLNHNQLINGGTLELHMSSESVIK
ncbi:GH92 family glycosyl hydrolase [Aurantibacter crassamenti]|uniref:GH92 family glycosyl hydrolase n=1 Tax=Aurantibacter crassamenti TaxID=1837375 RepID=UPI00193A69F1|nr:GH92 family glycosyl hydrolase [Aurantibacter crassamenti]MBM1105620.1 GH92 family glycosyl hydrolase [Aurantibacter crassamenti]